MKACIVIPARYASLRYPGKPLALLRGASGVARTLIERSVMAARAAAGDTIPVFVATDDARIAAEARRIGADVIMTSPDCRNGTERVAEAVRRAGIMADVVVNLQGDAPLTPPHFVRDLIAALAAETECGMATPCLRCDTETVRNLLADRRAGRVGATTVVCDRRGRALYFSKGMIPFMTEKDAASGAAAIFHHVGVYAYRPAALAAYSAWSPGPLEMQEGLEQLRFLENGQPIRMVEVTAPGAVFWELNNPSDIPLIEGYLARMGRD
jgi:3-deoxy-manno-octulosonate cytidylyltransferase (CMP-KDO synthetase)